MVGTSGKFRVLAHFRLHNFWHGVVILVYPFTALEIGIGVLRRSANGRLFGSESPLAMSGDQIVINHFVQNIEGDFFNFLEFMAGAEPVKEMEEGDARAQCACVGDSRQIHYFLDAV